MPYRTDFSEASHFTLPCAIFFFFPLFLRPHGFGVNVVGGWVYNGPSSTSGDILGGYTTTRNETNGAFDVHGLGGRGGMTAIWISGR